MQIGEARQRAARAIDTIRFYERRGLAPTLRICGVPESMMIEIKGLLGKAHWYDRSLSRNQTYAAKQTH